jgi:hypothetical protein
MKWRAYWPQLGSRILSILVLLLLAALVRKAWMDLDVAWDSVGYHLPFAGLRATGISSVAFHGGAL